MRPIESRKEMNLQKLKRLQQYLLTSPRQDPRKILQLMRESLGFNQTLFAEAIGVTLTTVSRWERLQQTQRILTWEQCLALNQELNKIGFSILDFPFFTIAIDVPNLNEVSRLEKFPEKELTD
jgi:transcriptional regulator with XRE-family HTH domain